MSKDKETKAVVAEVVEVAKETPAYLKGKSVQRCEKGLLQLVDADGQVEDLGLNTNGRVVISLGVKEGKVDLGAAKLIAHVYAAARERGFDGIPSDVLSHGFLTLAAAQLNLDAPAGKKGRSKVERKSLDTVAL